VRGGAITEYYLAAWFLYVLTSLWSEQQLTERVRDFALHKEDFNQQYYFSVSWGKRDILLRAWEEHSEKEEPQRIWATLDALEHLSDHA
jgi:lipopolysaccharide biosynthesis glycosyltransferase